MRFHPLLALCALPLAACGDRGQSEDATLAALDGALTDGQAANGTDPLVMAALNDPIMTDPQLASKSNADAIRPPSQPYSDALPHPAVATGSSAPNEKLLATPAATPVSDPGARESLTLAALARAKGGAAAVRCASRLSYSADWAHRLPADLPLHPDARVGEAAGAQGEGCALRVVSFHVARPMQQVLDWYYSRATRAGYSAEHRADGALHLLGGARGRDGGAYMLFMTDRAGGGTDIDMVANGGA